MQISAKDLGWLETDGFCPRCFWIGRHDRKLPYQTPFAGIFSSIDAYTKHIVEGYFERNHALPPWLEGVGDAKRIVMVRPSEFRVTVGETILTGVPDALFQRIDDAYGIIDYKTARYTGTQDALMPVYEVQLNGYAYIAEGQGMDPVDELHLVYFEPPYKERFEELALKHTNGSGFEMPFTPTVHSVRKDTKKVERLLKKAESIYAMDAPPAGRDGCEDCVRLDGLMKIVGSRH